MKHHTECANEAMRETARGLLDAISKNGVQMNSVEIVNDTDETIVTIRFAFIEPAKPADDVEPQAWTDEIWIGHIVKIDDDRVEFSRDGHSAVVSLKNALPAGAVAPIKAKLQAHVSISFDQFGHLKDATFLAIKGL